MLSRVKTIFTFSFPVTFTFDLLDLKFALLVALVQYYVSTKLEVSMAFLLREQRGRRQTDGQGATFNPAL